MPYVGAYRHYKNNRLYDVIVFGRMESDLTEVVVYVDIDTHEVYVRPREEFFGEVDIGFGEMVRRFAPTAFEEG